MILDILTIGGGDVPIQDTAPIQDAIERGAASGAEGAASRAFDVLDENVWSLLWLMVLGALVSTCVVAVIRQQFGTSKMANECMGYLGALIWTAAIEAAFLKYRLGLVQWFPLLAASLTPAALASAFHRPIYRVGLLLWLTLRWVLVKFARKQGVPKEQIEEALGETATKLGFRKSEQDGA